MKILDLPDGTPVSIAGNVINYTSGGYRYVVRFPAAPASTSMSTLRDGRAQIAMGSLERSAIQITARESVVQAIFEKVGGKPAS